MIPRDVWKSSTLSQNSAAGNLTSPKSFAQYPVIVKILLNPKNPADISFSIVIAVCETNHGLFTHACWFAPLARHDRTAEEEARARGLEQ